MAPGPHLSFVPRAQDGCWPAPPVCLTFPWCSCTGIPPGWPWLPSGPNRPRHVSRAQGLGPPSLLHMALSSPTGLCPAHKMPPRTDLRGQCDLVFCRGGQTEGLHLGRSVGLPPHEESAEDCAPRPTPGLDLQGLRDGEGGLPLPSFRHPGSLCAKLDTYCPLLVVGGMNTRTQPGAVGGLWLGALEGWSPECLNTQVLSACDPGVEGKATWEHPALGLISLNLGF